MKIAIMGTGGQGGYIGAELARAGNDVTFIARGAMLAALLRDGLEVRWVGGDFRLASVKATDKPVGSTTAELIMLCVKAYDLTEAMEVMAPLVGPDTAIVPILNGVEHVRLLSERFGPDRVYGGVGNITAHAVGAGIVERQGVHGHIEFGAQDGQLGPRDLRIAEVLGIAPLKGKASSRILAGMWQKLAVNCAVNICCVVRGDRSDVMRGMPETGDLMRQLATEVLAVARASGVDANETAADAAVQFMQAAPPHFKPSLAIALDRGNRLELEALNGAVVRLGRQLGVPTPANDFLYACVKPYVAGRGA